ncbi:MAG: hypothetical protein NZL93_05420, partial [Chthoniobacterales bacterium]|nr:hypothetical protein [Chthoniobacterales bacterium]
MPAELSLEKFRQRLEEAALPKAVEADAAVDDFFALGESENSEPKAEITRSKAENHFAKLEIALTSVIASFLGCRENLQDSADGRMQSLRKAFFFSTGGKVLALAATAIIGVSIGLT